MSKLTIIGSLPQGGLARVRVADSAIEAVESGNFTSLDADIYQPDWILSSGFIDLQINGGLGWDFTQNPESVYELARQLPKWGCTSFLPTVITADFDTYRRALKIIKEAMQDAQGANILGVHLEGPYLNEKYKGAHDSRFLRSPDITEVTNLLDSDVIRMWTLAPELPGALKVIAFLVGNKVIVSNGHTSASYEEAQAAFRAGANYVTHLFNAMSPLHQRSPGLIAAALNNDQLYPPYLGVIADGIHVHPVLLKLITELAANRLTLVTDAMAGMGMEPGSYKLAGLDVTVDQTTAHLNDAQQTLAGSILTIDQAVRNILKFSSLSLPQALSLATQNPAKVLKLSDRLGSLKAGQQADIVLLDQALQVQLTLVQGTISYEKNLLAVRTRN